MQSNTNTESCRPSIFALLLGLGAFVACAETVQFSVLRPAKVNVRQVAGEGDPTVSVGSWQSSGSAPATSAQEVGQYLRELIVNSENGVVKFAETNGAVTLNGTMTEHRYNENVTSKTVDCKKTGSDGKAYDSTCTDNKREGVAKVRVSMNVIDQKGVTVAADTGSCEEPRDTYARDEEAPAIDWESVLLGCRHSIAEQLARNVVPFRVVVTKPWFSCGDADKECQAGLTQLRSANFEQALALFTRAGTALQSSGDQEAMAAVEWALTLTHEFSGNYESAEEHLKRAISLNPGEQAFATEVAAINQEEKSQQKLASQ